MSRLGSWIAASAALLLGCATPGYRVHIEVRAVDQVQQQELMGTLENTAKASGLVPVSERKEIREHFPGVFTSSYAKVLSQRRHDYNSITIEQFVAERRVTVDVANALRGMEPPLKAELDALGDVFVAQIAAIVGKEGLSVERGPTSIPLFY